MAKVVTAADLVHGAKLILSPWVFHIDIRKNLGEDGIQRNIVHVLHEDYARTFIIQYAACEERGVLVITSPFYRDMDNLITENLLVQAMVDDAMANTPMPKILTVFAFHGTYHSAHGLFSYTNLAKTLEDYDTQQEFDGCVAIFVKKESLLRRFSKLFV